MKYPPQFHWFFLQRRYAEALATLRPDSGGRSSSELWSLYRLGLYATVASSARLDGHWRGEFSAAVSLACCGRAAEAAEAALALFARLRSDARRAMLADALAPFLPELAAAFVEKIEAPASLRAALLLRTGARSEALSVLQAAFAGGEAQRRPELRLLMSNAGTGAPSEQIDHLNAFLARYGLPVLALQDPTSPPGPMNLKPATPLPPVRGPLVTVLMTAYQTARRIDAAISSVLGQTYQDIELIVVDDASSDSTGSVIAAWASRDARVKYLRLPRNVGTYAAKNIGLRHARGEFVTCHDSDDWSHPLKIERQVAPLLRHRRVVFTTSDWVRMQDDGTYYARPVHPLLRLNPSSPLFRRQVVGERTGFWDWVRTGADSEFYARLRLVFGRLAVQRVRQPLAFGAHRPNSLVNAADTGLSPCGIHPTRLAYWEAWGHWHIDELRAGRTPRIPSDPSTERSFTAPALLGAVGDDIAHCLQVGNRVG